MVFGRDVTVICKTTDRYGRTVGHVMVDGRDVNLAMLEAGMAWHYKEYDRNKRLAEAENEARADRRGLWADQEPVPPWDWRKQSRKTAPR
jgi:micrococcal nuclease